MGYIVTAPVAVVTVPLGKNASQVRFLEQGTALPDGIAQDQLDHLVSIGFIEQTDDDQTDPDPADDPADDPAEMTVDELKAYAAEHDIDLTGASKKDDILAAIQAAQGE